MPGSRPTGDLRDTITLRLDHEVTKRLAERAARLGLSTEAFLIWVLHAEAGGLHTRAMDKHIAYLFRHHGDTLRRLANS